MPSATIIELPNDILDAIFAGAKELYPRESFLLLRGKKKKSVIRITDLVLAPFAVHGKGFAHFNPYMFSGDFSLVGTVHSHPSGNIRPSHVDLNYFFGRVLMIVGYPFEGQGCVAVYDGEGERMILHITTARENQDEEFF
ncbi:MAG TPA: Mov34/MPN/PAD-1 family protein [Candidatus Nanoarchaeia archaeon]|nr:Mov34/MPN/PAD-1 family protein [Candidatus Nanoarchaeia archaeon]